MHILNYQRELRQSSYYGKIFIYLLAFLFAFLVALQLMILSFKSLNASMIEHIIVATSNPFIGLFIGLLVTALIHSSSTTTTTIVAIVASGTVSLENAVYMVMGANIGTTVTSTMVSMGHITRKKEFRKAIVAGTVHDFFNIFTTIILFPLEYYFKILSSSASYLSSFMGSSSSIGFPNLLSPVLYFINPIPEYLIYISNNQTWFTLLLGMALLFSSIRFISLLFKDIIFDKSYNQVEHYFFGSPMQSLFFGIVVTGIVQSSTLVTSVIVPIVANNRLSIKKAFPIIMGANIGTTFTAFLAAMSSSETALSIALCHVLFNCIGVFIFFPIKYVRNIPVRMARLLSKIAIKNRLIGLVYIVLVFFVIPFGLIYFSREKVKVKQYTYTENSLNNDSFVATIDFKNKKESPKPKILFYKQIQFSNQVIEDLGEKQSLKSNQKNDSIFVNQLIFLLRNKNNCWESKDANGKYVMCVENILPNYRLSEYLRFDTCFVFTKKYLTKPNHKHIHRYYLSKKEKIILSHELINYAGKLLAKEELIEIMN